MAEKDSMRTTAATRSFLKHPPVRNGPFDRICCRCLHGLLHDRFVSDLPISPILKYPERVSIEMRDDMTSIEAYWASFFSSLPEGSPYPSRKRTEERWGEGAAMADELGGLIAEGTKTATCSALAEWEADGDVLPQVGDLTMVLKRIGRAVVHH